MAKKKVLVIVDREIKPGFELAGVDVWAAKDGQEAQKLLLEALESTEYGIVILEEDFLEELDPKVRTRVLDSVVPLVVPINIRESTKVDTTKYVEDLIRRAVGFQIKIRG